MYNLPKLEFVGDDNIEDLRTDNIAIGLNQISKKVHLPNDVKGVRGLDIAVFPTNKNKIYQRQIMKDNIIPTHPSSVIINGKSGSGKSNLICNLLCRPIFYGKKDGKHYFDEIYMFSPTANSMDDLCTHLLNHTPLTEANIYNEFDEEKLMEILEDQKKDIKKNGIEKSKRLLILLDDIQADQSFLNSKTILTLFTMNRHYNTSTYLCGQSFVKTPRSCRLQANNIIFFNGSKSEVKKIVEEFSPPELEKKEFQKLIAFAVKEPFSFLHICMRVPWKKRFRKKFDTILELMDS